MNYAIHLDMAKRLIDRAIRMFFEEDDALFVLAIANPGHVLLHDIARELLPEGSHAAQMAKHFAEERLMLESGKLVTSVSDVLKVLRGGANSLKHINEPPNVSNSAVFATLVVAVNDARDLNAMSGTMLLFAAWAFAKENEGDWPRWEEAEKLFPDLDQLSELEQLRVGRERLNDAGLMEIMVGMADPSSQETVDA